MGLASLDIFIIFLISGMKLKTDDVKRALRAYKSLSYGICSILLLTPLASLGFVNMDGALSVREFAYGLAIFALMPTTLSSGVILTRDAKGNVALALLLTVATNLLAVLIIPFSLGLVFSSAGDIDVSIEATPMIVKLLLSILLPLCIGKIARETSEALREIVGRFNITLKLFSSFCLIMVPWMKVSSASDDMSEIDGVGIVEVIALGIALHLVYLGLNSAAAVGPLGLAAPEMRAVTIMCSQKTLPVAVAVIDFLPDNENDDGYLGEPGIMVVSCIIAHFVQIVIDAVLASYWSHRGGSLDKGEGTAVFADRGDFRSAEDNNDTCLEEKKGDVEMLSVASVAPKSASSVA